MLALIPMFTLHGPAVAVWTALLTQLIRHPAIVTFLTTAIVFVFVFGLVLFKGERLKLTLEAFVDSSGGNDRSCRCRGIHAGGGGSGW